MCKHKGCPGTNKFKLGSSGIDLILTEMGMILPPGTNIRLNDQDHEWDYERITLMALLDTLLIEDLPMQNDYSFTKSGRKGTYCYAPTTSEENTYLLTFVLPGEKGDG